MLAFSTIYESGAGTIDLGSPFGKGVDIIPRSLDFIRLNRGQWSGMSTRRLYQSHLCARPLLSLFQNSFKYHIHIKLSNSSSGRLIRDYQISD